MKDSIIYREREGMNEKTEIYIYSIMVFRRVVVKTEEARRPSYLEKRRED